MKRIFPINRRVIEILVTLLLVFIAAGYYYLIYVPGREDEIIARRFRTLQRIEKNIQEKFQGYMAAVKNCLSQSNDPKFKNLVINYNKENDNCFIRIIKNESHPRPGMLNKKTGKPSKENPGNQFNYDTAVSMLTDSVYLLVKPVNSGNPKKILLRGNCYHLNKDGLIKSVELEATIDYREFILPLLKKNVFDQYIVFNYKRDSSTVVYETFPSGISFNNIDSLFDAKEKVYSSRVVKIETGGLKYLAFLHPCGYSSKNERIVAGLYREDFFNSEKQKLPESMVTTLLFIALFCFLLMPFLRLGIMGKKDKMRAFDVATVYLAFLLLVPAIMLLFLWNRKFFTNEDSGNKNSKEVLAAKISENLSKEISASYDWLDYLDNLYTKDSRLKVLQKERIGFIGDTAAREKEESGQKQKPGELKTDAIHYLDKLVLPCSISCKNLQLVAWLDENGKEWANWSFKDVSSAGNYKDRKYFKDSRDTNYLALHGDKPRNCVIEPIISRTDGKFKIILARLSRNTNLVVVASTMITSTVNPIMPLGYMFSIVDRSGNTIFDSDTSSNLNENLLEEISDAAELKAVLQTSVKREFTSRFKDNKYTILAQPMEGLPWYVVIFEDTSFDTAVNTQSFSFTMLVIFWIFLVICFQIIVVIGTYNGNSKLLKNKVDLFWLQPKKSMAHDYLSLSGFNLCLLLLVSVYCLHNLSVSRVTEYVFLFTLIPLVTALAALFCKTVNTKNHLTSVIIISVCIALMLIACFHYDAYALAGPLLLVGFSALLYWLYLVFSKLIARPSEKYFIAIYSLMIVSRVLLTFALPVFIFFKCIALFEHRLQERLVLLDFAHKVEWHAKNYIDLQDLISTPTRIKGRPGYLDSQWISRMDSSEFEKGKTSFTPLDSANEFLLNAARVKDNDSTMQEVYLGLIKPSPDSVFAFNDLFSGDATKLYYPIRKMHNLDAKTTTLYLLSSGNFICRCPDITEFPKGFLFWFLLVAAIAFCYWLLRFAVSKIFAGTYADSCTNPLNEADILNNDRNRFVFVQGIQDEHSGEVVRQILVKKEKVNFYEKSAPSNDYTAVEINLALDSLFELPGKESVVAEKPRPVYFSNLVVVSGSGGAPLKEPWAMDAGNNGKQIIPSEITLMFEERVKHILFSNFEFILVNTSIQSQTLKWMEKLSGYPDKKIIISSSVSCDGFIKKLDRFNCTSINPDHGKKIEKKEQESAADESRNNCAEAVSRWNYLFGNFVTVPLNHGHYFLEDGTCSSREKDDRMCCINSECFSKRNAWLADNYCNKIHSKDCNVLQQQKLNSQRYLAVWRALSPEEQFILVDLAEDGLVNAVNFTVLEALIERGLIKENDGVLQIFNASFRNFILTAFNSGDIKSIQAEITGESSWNEYKYPVLIILGSLVYFVLTSNPEKFGNILPFISGIMAGIPTIAKILSFIKPAPAKS